jgi:hypothetical protein
MQDDELLELLRGRSWIPEALAGLGFDASAAGAPGPLRLPDGPLEPVAGDGAGGGFLLAVPVGHFRPVVHAGPDGAGGLVASGVREALALVVGLPGLPGLREALAVPIGADGGAALRARLTEADDALRAARPELAELRARLRAELELPAADDLLPALHAAAADEGYRPVGYRSLLPA